MPYPSHTTATGAHQRAIAYALTDREVKHANGEGSTYVDAAGQLMAMKHATDLGYSWPVEDVQKPYVDELSRLQREGSIAAVRFASDNYMELDYERRCLARATAMARLESGPSLAAQLRLATKASEVQLAQRALVARARQIMADHQATQYQNALAQAAQEITS